MSTEKLRELEREMREYGDFPGVSYFTDKLAKIIAELEAREPVAFEVTAEPNRLGYIDIAVFRTKRACEGYLSGSRGRIRPLTYMDYTQPPSAGGEK